MWIHSQRVALVARSINGFIAALVASEDRILEMLAGVVLVAPVFDVIEMMDNYRSAYGVSARVEKLWRGIPGYGDPAAWEDRSNPEPGKRWLNFFGCDVSLAVLADIFRQDDPAHFRFTSFKRAIGKITQNDCPVYVLSNPDDPITGSKAALESLERAAGGGGLIRSEYYSSIEIQSSHLLELQRDQYPFALRDEVKRTGSAVRSALACMGLPTVA